LDDKSSKELASHSLATPPATWYQAEIPPMVAGPATMALLTRPVVSGSFTLYTPLARDTPVAAK